MPSFSAPKGAIFDYVFFFLNDALLKDSHFVRLSPSYALVNYFSKRGIPVRGFPLPRDTGFLKLASQRATTHLPTAFLQDNLYKHPYFLAVL
jgi:hypothetical protein